MVVRHHEETAHEYGVPLDVDWGQYRKQERLGLYKLFGAFAQDRLVGYNGFVLCATMQAQSFRQAFNDVVYLDPAHRRGLAGARLIRLPEAHLRQGGVRRVVYYAPMLNLNRARTDAKLASLLRHLGYGAYETSHAKLL